jgi:hypothetical protein
MDKELILIWTNIALVVTVLGATMRLTWFMAKLDSKVDLKANSSDLANTENKANRAHERIDELKETLDIKGLLR